MERGLDSNFCFDWVQEKEDFQQDLIKSKSVPIYFDIIYKTKLNQKYSLVVSKKAMSKLLNLKNDLQQIPKKIYDLQIEKTLTFNVFLWKWESSIYCHYSQFHSDSEWLNSLESRLWVK